MAEMRLIHAMHLTDGSVKMSSAHVRLVAGEKILYNRFPDRVCIVEKVYDQSVPVHYDIKIPLMNGSEDMQDRFLRARGIKPADLRAVDEVPL